MQIKINSDIQIHCDVILDEAIFAEDFDLFHQTELDEHYLDYINSENQDINKIKDESSWLLEEIDKTKNDTHVNRFETLCAWVDICNNYNLLPEVSYLTKKYYNDMSDKNLSVAINNAMQEWDI
jgi:hypothetical protein